MKLNSFVKRATATMIIAGAITTCIAAAPPTGLASAKAEAEANIAPQQTKPIFVYFNSMQLTTSDTTAIIKDGNLLLPLGLLGGIPGASFSFDTASQTIYASYDTHKGSLRIGEQSGTVDGHSMTFAGKAVLLNKRIYVPARFAVAAIGGTILWDAKYRIASIFGSQYVTANGKGGQYRLDGTTGALYFKMKGQQQKLIGKSIAKLNLGYIPMATMSVISIGKDSELITISHIHGEPLINDEEYTLFVRNGVIVHQMQAHYWQFSPRNIVTAGDLAVMTDGRNVQLVNGDAQIVRRYSLPELAGLAGGAATFDIESVHSDFLLFRSTEGWLYIADFKSGKTTTLYQTFKLDPKQLAPFYDGITFKEQDGNKLYFEVASNMDGHHEILSYGIGGA
ncbi:copper amine oxidase N-terminal domain-containing protein [Paenibacillus sp. OV219]|uniref:copper amine oxidase N-terminal domain-containing protein n=1 Tax=Paenibacillus sp. OV219 TaxID=1884377 RepID=UPI0008B2FEEA|nr:copper amine oxidase N-terminal domain-containing protein [Paenibacillus sp. OV219]SEO39928.1 Copper amine oxidase N-terminal domain-containing protein [Paenibacillus sp. OV219]